MAIGRTNVGVGRAYPVTLTSPTSLPTASYTIKDSGNVAVASGSNWGASMTFNLERGNYTLTLTAYGWSATKTFTVQGADTIDVSSMFCQVTVSGAGSLTLTHKVNNYTVGTSNPFYVLRASSSKTYTATAPSYSGLSTAPVATVTSTSFTPNSASVTISPTITGTNVLLTTAGTLGVPSNYTIRMFVIGGGCYDGCSGYVEMNDYSVPQGNHTITIGEGSTTSGASGGTTSFGTIVSAIGGTSTEGGSGKKGSGRGTFGGGGGGNGGSGSNSGSSGGSGGTYGGSGGSGGKGGGYKSGQNVSVRGSAGNAGGTGTELSTLDSQIATDQGITSPSHSGGSAGAGGSRTAVGNDKVAAGGGGGGGGGGYGAKGGNGATGGTARGTTSASGGSGGGGGGLLGGNGANGSSGYALGYGAGGGGAGGMLDVALVSSKAGVAGAILMRWVG